MEQSLYIAHHGIRGQKWGVRNYQNTDGSLTTAGRLRYGVGSALRGGVFNTSGAVSKVHGYSKQAKRLARFGTALAKAKSEQYGNSAKQGLFRAKKIARSLPGKLRTQKSVAGELRNRAMQLDYYTKKNSAVKQIMQRYADVAYLSERRFQTRASAGREWVSNVLRPLQGSRWDSPRRLLSKYAPVTRDMQESFNAAVLGTHYSAKKIHDMFGAWPNRKDNYRKSWY